MNSMKIRHFKNTSGGFILMLILASLLILTLIGSFYIAFFPMLFAFTLWATSLMGVLLFFARISSDQDVPIEFIKVDHTGFIIGYKGKIQWSMVAGVNLSVFIATFTSGPSFRHQQLNPVATARIRAMSGGGFFPELTRNVPYGVLTVYTSLNGKPAIEFRCRLPLFRPGRVLNRIRRIGQKSGTMASFSFNVHKTGKSEAAISD